MGMFVWIGSLAGIISGGFYSTSGFLSIQIGKKDGGAGERGGYKTSEEKLVPAGLH